MPTRQFSPLVDVVSFEEGSPEQEQYHKIMDQTQASSHTDPEVTGDAGPRTVRERAEVVAHQVHAGQFRKDGKTPYIHHPADVAGMMAKHGASDDVVSAAWLHDTQEEGGKPEDLVGFSDHTKLLVNQLTKQKGQDKVAYLKSLHQAHPDAVLIKVADRIANLRDGTAVKGVMPDGWLSKYLSHTNHILDAAHHHGLGAHPLVQELHKLKADLS